METVSIEKARATLGELVERARLIGEPIRITRYGRPAAVIVSADWFDRVRESPKGADIVQPGGEDDR